MSTSSAGGGEGQKEARGLTSEVLQNQIELAVCLEGIVQADYKWILQV